MRWGGWYSMFDLIGFDADDTLWDNEIFYQASIDAFVKILAPYGNTDQVRHWLDQTESRNIGSFGYGIKSFVLSMIETAVEISNHNIPAGAIQQIIDLGKGMLTADMTPLEGVEATLQTLAQTYPLMLITKGDLMDQEAKLERSGLGKYFTSIEVVSEKTPDTYRRILERHQTQPEKFLMVGNSLKSDIWPVCNIGGWAVLVPYANTWVHEMSVEGAIASSQFYEIDRIALLPELVNNLSRPA